MAVRKNLNVVRDYIPEDTELTASERARRDRFKAQVGRGVHPDFIPGEAHERKPGNSRTHNAAEALDRAMAAQASAAREEYENARLKLQGLNVMQAVEAIRQAPFSIQELMLVVETREGGRKGIISAFPPIDPAAVGNWENILADAPVVEEEPEPEPQLPEPQLVEV